MSAVSFHLIQTPYLIMGLSVSSVPCTCKHIHSRIGKSLICLIQVDGKIHQGGYLNVRESN